MKDYTRQGRTVVEVDIDKAEYQGRPWKSLGDFGKRKFENMLVLKRPTERLKVTYVQTSTQ